MQSLRCIKPFEFEYIDSDISLKQAGYSLLKIKRVGICGTDLHAYEGTQPFFNYPRILGHELAAEIIETDAPGFSIGENVTIIPYFNCGDCIACNGGKPNCCVHLNVFGVHIDGGMREYVSVPSSQLIHGNGLSEDELALIEPLAIAAHGIGRGNVSEKDTVLVIGAGPIGLATMEFARIAGSKVIAMDINGGRLAFCKNTLAVKHTINPRTENAIEALKEITNGNMPSVIVDATGNLAAINEGFSYLAHTGTYVLIGLQKRNIEFNHPEFHKREATLMSSRNATRTDFEYVINCIQSKQLDPLKLITHRVSFNEVKGKFDSWLDPDSGVIKAMVTI